MWIIHRALIEDGWFAEVLPHGPPRVRYIRGGETLTITGGDLVMPLLDHSLSSQSATQQPGRPATGL